MAGLPPCVSSANGCRFHSQVEKVEKLLEDELTRARAAGLLSGVNIDLWEERTRAKITEDLRRERLNALLALSSGSAAPDAAQSASKRQKKVRRTWRFPSNSLACRSGPDGLNCGLLLWHALSSGTHHCASEGENSDACGAYRAAGAGC